MSLEKREGCAGHPALQTKAAVAKRLVLPCSPRPPSRNKQQENKDVESDADGCIGRAERFLVAFGEIDKSITGDWFLELHGIPETRKPMGDVARFTSVIFPRVQDYP